MISAPGESDVGGALTGRVCTPWPPLASGAPRSGCAECARLLCAGSATIHAGAHIVRKLQLETKAELVVFALANGLIGAT